MRYPFGENASVGQTSPFFLTAILSLLIVVSGCGTEGGGIKPFASDGCSVFPDGTLQHKDLWLSCCEAHDYTYWQGGTKSARLASDLALEHCVSSVGEPQIAQLMLAGVRVGGSPYFPTRYRWGYGWPWPRGYKQLTEAEKKQIEALSEPSN